MKNKARVVEIFSAGVALFVPMNLVWGQSCQCDNSPVAGIQQYVLPLSHFADPRVADQQVGLTYKPGRQLPAGWPDRWGGLAIVDDGLKGKRRGLELVSPLPETRKEGPASAFH